MVSRIGFGFIYLFVCLLICLFCYVVIVILVGGQAGVPWDCTAVG